MYLNTFHLNVIGLSAPIARLAGRLEDGDCLPRALTPGVVDLMAATYSLETERNREKLSNLIKLYIT